VRLFRGRILLREGVVKQLGVTKASVA